MSSVAGTVVDVHDGRATVRCQTEPAGCGACAAGRGCGGLRREGPPLLEIAAELDGRSLAPGESVRILAEPRDLFAAAVRLYLPPLAGLLTGPMFIRLLGQGDGPVSLLAAGIGLAAGLLLARRLARAALVVVQRGS
jgi:positive regulator of sigma E activity